MRQVKCYNCGVIYLTDKKHSHLCPDCTQKSREKVHDATTRICADCGKPFKGKTSSFRCPDCQYLADKESHYKSKKNGPARKLGDYDKCQSCGKPYIVNGPLQKYCPDCAPIITRENRNKANRKRARERYDLEAARAERAKRQKVCVVCGKLFRSDHPTVTCSPKCSKQHYKDLWNTSGERKRERQGQNSKKRKDNPKSGVAGISWKQGKWQLRINDKYFGLYDTIEEAAAAKEKYLATDERYEKKIRAKSGIAGIYNSRGKWQVQLYRDGKKIHIGIYKTIEEAVEAKERYLAEEKNEK